MPRYLKWAVYRDPQYAPKGKEGLFPIEGIGTKTRQALLNGTLHKVSAECCEYLKKIPAKAYEERERERGISKKRIIGIMGDESLRRKYMMRNHTCFNKKGDFYPIHDLTEEMRCEIEEYCGVTVPHVYQYVRQTGCAGCPYGQHGKDKYKTTDIGLSFCKEGQRKFILDYFAESYAFREYHFQPIMFL